LVPESPRADSTIQENCTYPVRLTSETTNHAKGDPRAEGFSAHRGDNCPMSDVCRRYPPCPLIGVGVLVFDKDRVLLVKRERDPGKGRWSIPGGLLEVGEPLKEGARRETKEETGIDVEVDDLLDVIDNIVADEQDKVSYHYVLIDYLGHKIGGTLVPGTDVKEAQWATLEELDALSTTRTLQRLVQKAKLVHKAK